MNARAAQHRDAIRLGSVQPAIPKSSGVLQRKCACGNHTVSRKECGNCSKKQLRRGATTQGEAGIPAASTRKPTTHAFAEPHIDHSFSQVPTHTSAQAAKVPTAPVNDFEDCPVDWRIKANAALVIARKWVSNVVAGLSNLPYPFPAPVATLLNRHFRITDRGYVAEVTRHFNTINSALNSPIEFECETSCDNNVAAYVYRVWSDVHLCPVWYGLTSNGRANTIIHEIAHDAANRDDEAYIWQAKYSKLPVEDAIDNADSYSNFAQESYGP